MLALRRGHLRWEWGGANLFKGTYLPLHLIAPVQKWPLSTEIKICKNKKRNKKKKRKKRRHCYI